MSSSAHGINTSATEVTHVSSHGIWLLSGGHKHFLPYEEFPWFKEAPIGKVLNIEEVSPGHFHWPDLDIDLGIDTIETPRNIHSNLVNRPLNKCKQADSKTAAPSSLWFCCRCCWRYVLYPIPSRSVLEYDTEIKLCRAY
jgi:hypothetical protein